jgi:GAF domain-containing protein
MIEWFRQLIIPHFDDEELNQRVFNLNVILFTTFVVMLLGILAILLQIGKRTPWYVVSNSAFIAIAALIVALCFYLARQGRVQGASITFIAMMTLVCTGAVVVGGTLGALPVILIIPIATAGVTMGAGVSLVLAFWSLATLLISGFLEINGILKITYPAPEATILLNIFDVGFGFFFVTMGVWLAGYSLRLALRRTRQAVVETDRYRQELEKSLVAEQAIRDRLQRAISQYSAFLERIGQGDYEARLSLSEEDENLITLEQHINVTVDMLVEALTQSRAALQETEATQRRYLRQSWRDYIRSKPAADFELLQPEVTIPREKLLPAFREAVTQRRPLTLAGHKSREEAGGVEPYTAVVTPITLRGEVVGTLGICRETGERPWTEDERAIIEAVAQRLALAAENLRLFENVQRRAAREQLARELTDKMRRAADVDALLQTTLREMAAALSTPNAFVQLSVPSDLAGNGDAGEMQSPGEAE